MRLVFICLLLFVVQLSFAQQPSKEELQAQMKQAKEEAQQQIRQMEADIAEAKKNGENPETIAEMEKNLATIKQMLGIIDKAATNERPKSPTKKSYPVVEYVSPIVPIALKQPVVKPTEKESKEQLLWYKGKKIDNVTLVTTAGMVVRYDRPNNRVIVKPDRSVDTTFPKLVSKLSRTETVKNDFATRTTQITNSFLMFPEIMKAFEEFDYIRKRFDKIARNTIDFPAVPIVRNLRVLPGSSGFGDGEAIISEELNNSGLEQAYQELMSLMNNPPGINVPAPPKRPNDLCLCDQGRRAQYENELDNWLETCWKYENDLLSKLKNIHRYLADNSMADLSSMPTIHADLQRALDLVISRKEQKIDVVHANWGQDILRNEAILMAKLALNRERQKLGKGGTSSGSGSTEPLSDEIFALYIKNEMDAKNYNVVFDYSLYLSREFHKQLLGGNVDVNMTKYFWWQDRLKLYNRFTMSIDLSFEVEWRDADDEPDVMITGTLSADPVLVSIGRMGCKWQLFLTNTDYLNGDEQDFRIPFKVTGGEKKIKKKPENNWNIYTYVGPRDLLMVFPSVRMDFCPGGARDSAIMDVLRFKNELYNQQYVKVQVLNEANVGIYQDPEKKYVLEMLAGANKLLIPADTAKQRHAEIVTMAGEMQDFRSDIRLDNPTGNSVMDELKIEYSANLQQHKKQKELADISHTKHAVVLFDAVNNSDVLIEENKQVKYDQPQIREYMKRGSIILKVKHTPSPGWRFGPQRS